MSEKKSKEALSPLEGENQFLTRLVLGLLALTLISWSYTGYFSTQVVSPVKTALESGDDANIREHLATFESTHFFSNVVIPDNLIPGEDPILGGSIESDAATKLLPSAVAAALLESEKKAGEPIDGIRLAMRDKTSDGRERRDYFTTTVPEITNWLELEGNQFLETSLMAKDGRATNRAIACANFAPCAAAYVKRKLPRLSVFLKVTASRSSGEAKWTNGEITQAMQYPTALIKGFGASESTAPYSPAEIALMTSLLDTQVIATQNGKIFSFFISIVLLITLITRLLSDRIKPQSYV